MGEVVFRKIQYGLEAATAHGTAVAATKMFGGQIKVPPDRKILFPEERLGLRTRSQRSVNHQILADGITLGMEEAVFQKVPFFLSMGLKGGVTAAEATPAQGDYLWDFSHSLTASNTPDSTTIEFGDDTQAYEIEHCMARRYRFAGKVGQDAPVTFEADVFGKQISTCAFTNSLAVAVDTPMSANMAKFYIDALFANAGTTEKTSLLREWSIEIVTGVHPKFFAGGGKVMSSYGEGFLDCLATFTFEGNSEADTIWDLFNAQTARAIRLAVNGPQIGTGTTHSLIVDMFGSFEEVIPLGGEDEGNSLHTAIFHTHSNGLSTPKHFAVKCTTTTSSI
jgi:hypothetical protein